MPKPRRVFVGHELFLFKIFSGGGSSPGGELSSENSSIPEKSRAAKYVQRAVSGMTAFSALSGFPSIGRPLRSSTSKSSATTKKGAYPKKGSEKYAKYIDTNQSSPEKNLDHLTESETESDPESTRREHLNHFFQAERRDDVYYLHPGIDTEIMIGDVAIVICQQDEDIWERVMSLFKVRRLHLLKPCNYLEAFQRQSERDTATREFKRMKSNKSLNESNKSSGKKSNKSNKSGFTATYEEDETVQENEIGNSVQENNRPKHSQNSATGSYDSRRTSENYYYNKKQSGRTTETLADSERLNRNASSENGSKNVKTPELDENPGSKLSSASLESVLSGDRKNNLESQKLQRWHSARRDKLTRVFYLKIHLVTWATNGSKTIGAKTHAKSANNYSE